MDYEGKVKNPKSSVDTDVTKLYSAQDWQQFFFFFRVEGAGR